MTIHPDTSTAGIADTPRFEPPPAADHRECDDGSRDDAEMAQVVITGLLGAAEDLIAELRSNSAYSVAELLRALATTVAAIAVLLEANEAYTADVSPEALRPVRRARMLCWQAQRCLDTASYRAAFAPLG